MQPACEGIIMKQKGGMLSNEACIIRVFELDDDEFGNQQTAVIVCRRRI